MSGQIFTQLTKLKAVQLSGNECINENFYHNEKIKTPNFSSLAQIVTDKCAILEKCQLQVVGNLETIARLEHEMKISKTKIDDLNVFFSPTKARRKQQLDQLRRRRVLQEKHNHLLERERRLLHRGSGAACARARPCDRASATNAHPARGARGG